MVALSVVLATLCPQVCSFGMPGCQPERRLFPVFTYGPRTTSGGHEQRWGYIDSTGAVVIAPRFQWAREFSDGMAEVGIGRMSGFIDQTGKVVVPPTCFAKECGRFSQGLAAVSRLEDMEIYHTNFRYIDRAGRTAIDSQFRSAHAFAGGIAAVRFAEMDYGFIDRKGRVLLRQLGDSDFRDASEGLAAFRIRDSSGWVSGYIDSSGARVIERRSSGLGGDFHDGLAQYQDTAQTINVDVGYSRCLYGFIDRTGHVAIEPQFYWTEGFSEGLAAVQFPPTVRHDFASAKWGYVDGAGRVLIGPQYEHAWGFSEGLAQVKVGDKWGYIDTAGVLVIEPQFDAAEGFHEGRALVGVHDAYGYPDYGFIDKAGAFVVEPRLRSARSYSGGLAKVVFVVGRGFRCGYIDRRGETVWSASFEFPPRGWF
ncbi:WG repeat-containing protein [candidate division WOR-3 bacterium]|nr:WG repeat-containing protein [candidate division WOR-3 bacterium]